MSLRSIISQGATLQRHALLRLMMLRMHSWNAAPMGRRRRRVFTGARDVYRKIGDGRFWWTVARLSGLIPPMPSTPPPLPESIARLCVFPVPLCRRGLSELQASAGPIVTVSTW